MSGQTNIIFPFTTRTSAMEEMLVNVGATGADSPNEFGISRSVYVIRYCAYILTFALCMQTNTPIHIGTSLEKGVKWER
jgi:hypothetical protein